MIKAVFIFFLVFSLAACKGVSGGKTSKVTEEKLKDYIGQDMSVLYDDFKVISCNLKIAYFKDAYAVKIALTGDKEIVVVFDEKIILTKAEIENQCEEPKIREGKIAKIKFYKAGEEEISVE